MSRHHRIRLDDDTVRFEKRGWFGEWPLRMAVRPGDVRRIRLDVHTRGAFDIITLTLETPAGSPASDDDEDGHAALWDWLARHFDLDADDWQAAARDHIIASPGLPMRMVLWERR